MALEIRLNTDLLKSVGNTPLISIRNAEFDSSQIHVKLEWYNPFGSIKDRAAYYMIKRAMESSIISNRDSIIIEPTSGNTGIALAGIGCLMGFRVQAVIPEKISSETKIILRSMGAELLETADDLCPRIGKGTDQSIALAQAIVKRSPGRYFMPNQYENEANFLAHYEGTGPEILNEVGDKLTHVVIGIGTGGTVTGVAAFMKEHNPKVRIVAVEPQKNHHLQGLRNLEESLMPKVLERRVQLVDEWIKVSDTDAFEEVRFLAESEGLFVGPSSGAIMCAIRHVVESNRNANVVGVFADDGVKYKSVYREFNVFSKDEFEYFKNRARHRGSRLLDQVLLQA